MLFSAVCNIPIYLLTDCVTSTIIYFFSHLYKQASFICILYYYLFHKFIFWVTVFYLNTLRLAILNLYLKILKTTIRGTALGSLEKGTAYWKTRVCSSGLCMRVRVYVCMHLCEYSLLNTGVRHDFTVKWFLSIKLKGEVICLAI